MKLNADTLYYHLKNSFTFDYHRASLKQEVFGRPRYYTGPASKQGFLYLVTDENSILPAGTYVCTSQHRLTDPENTSCFIFPDSKTFAEVYNALQEIFDFYEEWEDACISSIERYQDFRNLLRHTYQVFGMPVCLFDNQFSIVAAATDKDDSFALFGHEGHLSLDTVNDLINNPHLRHLETETGVFDFDYDRPYKLFNFFSNKKSNGRIAAAVLDPQFQTKDALILGRLGEFVEILLNRFGTFQTSSVQNHLHTFLTDSLNGIVPQQRDLYRLTQNTGWAEEHEYMLVYYLPEHRLKKELYPPYLVSQIEELWPSACAVEYQNNVSMLINLSLYGDNRLSEFFQSLAYMVRDGLMIAGCSKIFRGLKEINLYFKQALYAIEFGQKKNPTRWYFRFSDYGMEYLLNYGIGTFKAEQVCHPALLLLREHDLSKQTSYYLTLYTFFEEQFNMSHAANKLYIHRSTFINRMERILELTKLNLDDYDTRLYLELSFRLLRDTENRINAQFYV